MSVPIELKKLYKDGRLLPFVGAGASMSVSWVEQGQPRRGISWSELVDQATKFLGYSDPSLLRVRGTDLQILEYYRLINGGGFAELTNWLYSQMRPTDAELARSKIHASLAKLVKSNIIYTTNYDDFLERALKLHGIQLRVIANEHDISKLSQSLQVVKFHGDFNHPDMMVLSESDYERRLRLQTAMDRKLNSDILGRAIVFIGYSFRDSNIAYLFRLVNDQFGALPRSFAGRRAYIALFNPSDFEYQLFHNRNIEVIPMAGDDKEVAISNLLEEIGS